ncbi:MULTISPECIES: Nramp family divalent metal transporter [Candidatus Nitrosocaldus]|uniref:Natural resistance-associated macrophage protein n=1 Tax=Candidatus Nitrosocaldus cavascurensis TaxID=2058097 RepID=A0A2K5APH7_9ARCH|nr:MULTISPECIES: Nramp family divalent metal transporter [Candidatus Nitrosocaldus]SPC33544.1 Natural resistance-associated macrophage protein [Candidatus Nitrosocaldus cavascurensis]
MRLLRLLRLFGPATIVSVAYMDPGNFGSNIASGSLHGLDLLWVVWMASAVAMLLQYLSGKLGIVAGRSLVDLTLSRLSSRYARIAYSIPLIAVIIATDMAEFLGIALGLHLLFAIPLHVAAGLAVIDVLILLLASEKRGRLELLIGLLVVIIGLSYVVQLYIIAPEPSVVLEKSVSITLDEGKVFLAASILGATVMPHALILHGYLTAERWNGMREKVKRHTRETIVYLAVAAMINASLQIAAYGAFYTKDIEVVDMTEAYNTLIPLYGSLAAHAFGIALLASGISSSLVSVVTGQKVFESIRGKGITQWKVRLVVRMINMVPLLIALSIGIKTIDILVYSQVVLSLLLPFVVIPLVVLISRMGIVTYYTRLAGVIAVILIIIINIMLIASGQMVH